MKWIGISIAFILAGLAGWKVLSETINATQVDFGGETWVFPQTVQEAVHNHKLEYKPPGFYYKVNRSPTYRVQLLASHQSGDFFNEHQSKEVLYSRPVEAYLFKIADTGSTFDSLLSTLQRHYNSSFQVERDSLTVGGQKKEVEAIGVTTLSQYIRIGLIKPYIESSTKKEITVGIYYNYLLSDLKHSIRSNAY